MLTYRLSLAMYRCESGYNGKLGTCPHCRRPHRQLVDGLCRACRQQAERDKPKPVRAARRCQMAGCTRPAAGPRSTYCVECRDAHRLAYWSEYNDRRREQRKEAR